MWKVKILTLFPENFPGMLQQSVTGIAKNKGIWDIEVQNLRDYGIGKYKEVDNKVFGGGNGMLLRADVIASAIDDFFDFDLPIIYMSPRGEKLTQVIVENYSSTKGVNIISGCYEGIDERLLNEYNVARLSVGDYILSSGDISAHVFVDACVRLLDGVISPESLCEESFSLKKKKGIGLLEYPQYTKPRVWRNHKVPGVLLEGNHAEIKKWRLDEAIKTTKEVRPDLWEQYSRIK